MKKLIALCMVIAMSTTVLCACSDDTDSTKGTSSDRSSQAEETITETDTESGTTESNDDDIISEDSFVDVGGTDLYIPDGFEEELAYGYYIYSKEFGNDTIYFAFHSYNWYGLDDDVDSYALEDVPDIEAERFKDTVGEVIDHYKEESVTTVESETNETINDLPFIIHKGTKTTEFREPEDAHNLKFTALYTLYDNNYYEKIPTSIILFSDCYDAETEAEMDRLANEIVNNTVWVLEY